MTKYSIYIGTDGEEATSHGADYVYGGMNPADALAKFINDMDVMREVRNDRPGLASIEAFDDDMSAAVYPLEDGAWELHVYTDDVSDIAITIPPTELVSLTDAADMLDVTRQAVHKLLQSGKLDGRKVGNTWSVCRASVERRISGK